jgi:hypothetical protein
LLDATRRMEFDGPTGAIVLTQYERVLAQLEEISLESPTASIAVAITAMKHKLSTYREAAEMKPAIVMANCPL